MHRYMIASSRLQQCNRIVVRRGSFQQSGVRPINNVRNYGVAGAYSFTASTKRLFRRSTSFFVAAGVSAGGSAYARPVFEFFAPRELSTKSSTSTCSSSSILLRRELDAPAVRKAE